MPPSDAISSFNRVFSLDTNTHNLLLCATGRLLCCPRAVTKCKRPVGPYSSTTKNHSRFMRGFYLQFEHSYWEPDFIKRVMMTVIGTCWELVQCRPLITSTSTCGLTSPQKFQTLPCDWFFGLESHMSPVRLIHSASFDPETTR